MAFKNTITSANATGVVKFDSSLFSVPIALEGFSTDASVSLDAYKPVETRMGVDGHLSGGFVPTPRVVKVSLEANSPSRELFAKVLETQDSLREAIKYDMVFEVPSIGFTYTGKNGFITGGANMPSAKKMLEPTEFEITFESWVGAPVGS